jgi:hypothetical protein
MSLYDYASQIGGDSTDSIVPASTSSRALAAKIQVGLPDGPSPWDNLKGQDRFFFPITIEGSRFNKLYPYRLVVIDTARNNAIVNGSANNADVVISNSGINGNFTLSFLPINNQWAVQLPITPESLNIADQFAINTSATLRGILEEHNGVRFKMITASGTFGVWPSRQTITQPPGTPSVVQSLFGGTIEAFGNLTSSVTRVINTATTGHPASKPNTPYPNDPGQAGLASTGYYQALFIQQFLEQYAEAKKRPENASWRLVFDIPKQNQSFVVTPLPFVWQQNKEKPLQVNYNMQFKAWRRVDLRENVNSVNPSIQPLSPGILQRILNTIAAARAVLSQALNLIAAVRSDIEAPLEALRQTALFVKQLAGVIISAIDLPSQLISDFKSAINSFATAMSFNNLLGNAGSNSSVQQSLSNLKSTAQQLEGLSLDAVAAGQLGNSAVNAQAINPANNIYSNPQANYLLLDQIPVSSLVLNVPQQNAVQNTLDQAAALTISDLKQFRATIQQLAIQLSNSFGSGSAFYNQVYNLPPPSSTTATLTLNDYDILTSLYDVMQSYDLLTASTQVDDQARQSDMQYVAGLAQNAGIAFSIPNSMILAPVPFGLTIEGIAGRYLGDPQRWLEIATLNALRDPYIDEDGFQYALLSNANGRQITIDNNENLYLGQTVILMSSTQTPSPRTILGIEQLSSTSYLVTLDGIANLGNFTTNDGAYMQAYLPGTVNSQQKIFIPSDISVPNDPHIIVPASTSVDPLTGMSKVDIMLTDTGDIAVNNYGDFRFSYGMTNIVQALKIKFGTQAGTALLHPEFGLGIKPGQINGSIDAQQIYSSINRMIQQDPRFAGVTNLQISLQGPVLTINLAVILANQQGIFPITFQVTNSVS